MTHLFSVVLQTTQFALQTRQVNVDRINTTYRRLSESGDDEQQFVDMPEKLSEQVAAINRDWAEVHRLADQLQPQDDSHSAEVTIEGQKPLHFSSAWCL